MVVQCSRSAAPENEDSSGRGHHFIFSRTAIGALCFFDFSSLMMEVFPPPLPANSPVMKTPLFTLSLFFLMSARMEAQSIWEWTFDTNATAATLGDGTLEWSTQDAQTLTTYGVTNGGTVPHIDGHPAGYLRIPAYTNPEDFAKLFFNGSHANGGGAYLNRYTIIMDVYFAAPYSWLPFFNTNESNGNDADFYVSPDGALGISPLGYSPAGAVTADEWHRIIFAADLAAGVVTYYIDGIQVFQLQSGTGLVDGRFSLYTGDDGFPDLILGNEGDSADIYTREWLLASFAFTDQPLSADEVTRLGGPKAAGIYVTAPEDTPELTIASTSTTVTLTWDTAGLLLQRSTDLSTWTPVAGSTTVQTYSEPLSASRAWFRLANP
jgi:hypothetical protein